MTSTEKTLTATIIAMAIVIAGLGWSHAQLVFRVSLLQSSGAVGDYDETALDLILKNVTMNTEEIDKLKAAR